MAIRNRGNKVGGLKWRGAKNKRSVSKMFGVTKKKKKKEKAERKKC